jgi:hypothetical protein
VAASSHQLVSQRCRCELSSKSATAPVSLLVSSLEDLSTRTSRTRKEVSLRVSPHTARIEMRPLRCRRAWARRLQAVRVTSLGKPPSTQMFRTALKGLLHPGVRGPSGRVGRIAGRWRIDQTQSESLPPWRSSTRTSPLWRPSPRRARRRDPALIWADPKHSQVNPR